MSWREPYRATSDTVRKISAGASNSDVDFFKEISLKPISTVRKSYKLRTVCKYEDRRESNGRAIEKHQMKEPPGISRGLFHQQAKSDGAQVLCRGLARLWIGDNVERELLSFVEVSHPGALDRADMHEDVLAAIIRLDEAEAFLAVEPLHDSLRHMLVFQIVPNTGDIPRSRPDRKGVAHMRQTP